MRLAALLAAISPALIPVTLNYGGLPPERYQDDTFANVFFLSDVEPICGKAEEPWVRFGCAHSPHRVTIESPCKAEYRFDLYAVRLCHELGHINGWPETHGP